MRRTIFATAALTLAAAAAPRAVHADTCTPSRAMLILDKSSSMVTGTIGGTPKWDIAVDALTAVVEGYQSSIELGLMLFPSPAECSPGSVFVDTGLGHGGAIVTALGEAPPATGNWTPMAQTLDAAATVPSLADAARTRYVILITDGWQWCSPYDPATRLAPVDSVRTLKAMGVTTYVVGFGDAVDALALNQMAVEGGTALAGCDPTGDTPAATSPCYYRADDPASLLTALDSIALQVSAETCDGIDNDCDGAVDEELSRECGTACGAGQETCSAGAWGGCTAPPVLAEICDGQDNDCDGSVDPGCACIAGEARPCGEEEGACARGTQACNADGTWGMCQGAVGPVAELCNGWDDDCDGATDEADGEPLCLAGELCEAGGCIADPSLEPAVDDDMGGDAAGCGCRAAGGNPAPAAPLFLVAIAGLALVRRRRA